MTYSVASDGLRTVVIDSGQTNTTDLGLDYLRGYVEQLDRILAGCAANTACRATYPNLRSGLYPTVGDLNAHPVVVRVKVGNKTIRVRIDGDGCCTTSPGGP